jgi:hypothetical protein
MIDFVNERRRVLQNHHPALILPLNYFAKRARRIDAPFLPDEAFHPESECGYSPLALRYVLQTQN